VANAELRVPLLQGLGWQVSPGIPPMDLALFFDAGVAWSRSQEPDFLGGDRDPVTSYGVALRTNLYGVVIIELDFVHPNDRPDKGWLWQLGFTPGF
jgi:outer membrane protein assembly factor BamA